MKNRKKFEIAVAIIALLSIFWVKGQKRGKDKLAGKAVNTHKQNIYEKYIKRPQDFCCAVLGIIFLSPVMLLVAILVRLKLGSPVIFKQERPGFGGKVFVLYKFRSTSLDELPELWNILNGTLSIVGPRPLLVQYLPLYTEHQARRHEVRPGLTGYAQVHGRNALTWEDKFDKDVYYVDHISFLGDWKIILHTISSVLKREGINSETSETMEEFKGTANTSSDKSLA